MYKYYNKYYNSNLTHEYDNCLDTIANASYDIIHNADVTEKLAAFPIHYNYVFSIIYGYTDPRHHLM